MSLALAVLTKNGGSRIRRLMNWATTKSYFDDIKVFVDKTTTDDTAGYCLWMGATVVEGVEVHNIDAALAFCHSPEKLKTDWALHLGDDELMGEWFDQDVEMLMKAPYEVYSFPRYNLINDPHHYVANSPWYPDWAQRLFRPGSLIHNGEVHEGAAVTGRLSMARPHIFHCDYLDLDKQAREAKWKNYLKQGVVEASRKRGLPDDYYRRFSLPEDYDVVIESCEENL